MDKYFEKITSMWLAHTLEPIMGYRLVTGKPPVPTLNP